MIYNLIYIFTNKLVFQDKSIEVLVIIKLLTKSLILYPFKTNKLNTS